MVKTLPGSLISKTNGITKLINRLNKMATITAMMISELFPAPDLPINGINKYNAPSIKQNDWINGRPMIPMCNTKYRQSRNNNNKMYN